MTPEDKLRNFIHRVLESLTYDCPIHKKYSDGKMIMHMSTMPCEKFWYKYHFPVAEHRNYVCIETVYKSHAGIYGEALRFYDDTITYDYTTVLDNIEVDGYYSGTQKFSFPIITTEEELFQQSLLQEFKLDLGIEDFLNLNKIKEGIHKLKTQGKRNSYETDNSTEPL